MFCVIPDFHLQVCFWCKRVRVMCKRSLPLPFQSTHAAMLLHQSQLTGLWRINKSNKSNPHHTTTLTEVTENHQSGSRYHWLSLLFIRCPAKLQNSWVWLLSTPHSFNSCGRPVFLARYLSILARVVWFQYFTYDIRGRCSRWDILTKDKHQRLFTSSSRP